MTLEQLKGQGIAEYSDLIPFIDKIINRGKNEWGFVDKSIVLVDKSCWDYIPEDELYELAPDKTIEVIEMINSFARQA